MVPERQKGNVYYRCKGVSCATKTVREEWLERAVMDELERLSFCKLARAKIDQAEPPLHIATINEQRSALVLQVNEEERRLDRLQDLLLDQKVDISLFDQKLEQINFKLATLRSELKQLPCIDALKAQEANLAELQNSLVYLYEMANRHEKRTIIENVWPNRTVCGKEPLFKPYSWVLRGQNTSSVTNGAPERDACRTLIALLDKYRTEKQDEDAT